MTGIQSFFEFHEIPVGWKRLFKFFPEQVSCNLRAYKKDEIKKMLSVADLRDKCVILIMASGGLRAGAITDLEVKHQKVLDKNSGIGILNVYPKSKHDSYITLLTPECMEAIRSYLQWRKEHGERLTDESPLIRDKFDVFTARRNKPKHLMVDAIYKMMSRLIKKAGVYSNELQPDHSFRYFFNSALMNSDVNYKFKELLMGHSIQLDDHYYDSKTEQSRQKMLLEYKKAVEALCINPEFILRKQIAIYKEELSDIPRVEQLETHLATRIIEEEAIKKQLEKLREDKEKETQTIRANYEQDMIAMREEMEKKFQQILAKIDVAALK
jgi:integrase